MKTHIRLTIAAVLTRALPVSDQPTISLRHWMVVGLETTNHLVGIAIETGKARQSSPILGVTPEREIVTTSGRRYSLVGQSGNSQAIDAFVRAVFPKAANESAHFVHLARRLQ